MHRVGAVLWEELQDPVALLQFVSTGTVSLNQLKPYSALTICCNRQLWVLLVSDGFKMFCSKKKLPNSYLDREMPLKTGIWQNWYCSEVSAPL